LAALSLFARTAIMPHVGKFFTLASDQIPADRKIAEQTFVFVNGNDFPTFYCRIVPIVSGNPVPRRVTQLASMMDSNRIYRQDAHTLIISPGRGFVAQPVDRLMLSNRPFHLGARIERPDYVAEVISVTQDGRPAVVSFRFHLKLEDPSLRWLCWKSEKLQPFKLPEVGSSVVLPEVDVFEF
jgi:hypothetical protein